MRPRPFLIAPRVVPENHDRTWSFSCLLTSNCPRSIISLHLQLQVQQFFGVQNSRAVLAFVKSQLASIKISTSQITQRQIELAGKSDNWYLPRQTFTPFPQLDQILHEQNPPNMKINEHTGPYLPNSLPHCTHSTNRPPALLTPRILLVPYSPHHVPTYHSWMQDEVRLPPPHPRISAS
jgi:hypothetical protein